MSRRTPSRSDLLALRGEPLLGCCLRIDDRLSNPLGGCEHVVPTEVVEGPGVLEGLVSAQVEDHDGRWGLVVRAGHALSGEVAGWVGPAAIGVRKRVGHCGPCTSPTIASANAGPTSDGTRLPNDDRPGRIGSGSCPGMPGETRVRPRTPLEPRVRCGARSPRSVRASDRPVTHPELGRVALKGGEMGELGRCAPRALDRSQVEGS